MKDAAEGLRAAIEEARLAGSSVRITGSGSKAALAGPVLGEPLSTLGHTGVIDYRPEELYIRARAGTTLAELEQAVAEQGQLLPFDPPQYGGRGTVGGAVACGLSGPARPWRGSVGDSVLGITVVNGLAQVLTFGGQVMKNVAGYDVSRLMVGGGGRLGLVLAATFKLLPAPAREITLGQSCGPLQALSLMRRWARLPLPITATCVHGETLLVRLSGAPGAINGAQKVIGGTETDPAVWRALRDHEHPFFRGETPLWRWCSPPAARVEEGDWLIEWSGSQRWWRTAEPADAVLARAQATDAAAQSFADGCAGPVAPALRALNDRVKTAFDPDDVLNRYDGESRAHRSA